MVLTIVAQGVVVEQNARTALRDRTGEYVLGQGENQYVDEGETLL